MNNNMNSNKLLIRTSKPEILPGGCAICDKIKNNKCLMINLLIQQVIINNKNEQERTLQLCYIAVATQQVIKNSFLGFIILIQYYYKI